MGKGTEEEIEQNSTFEILIQSTIGLYSKARNYYSRKN